MLYEESAWILSIWLNWLFQGKIRFLPLNIAEILK